MLSSDARGQIGNHEIRLKSNVDRVIPAPGEFSTARHYSAILLAFLSAANGLDKGSRARAGAQRPERNDLVVRIVPDVGAP